MQPHPILTREFTREISRPDVLILIVPAMLAWLGMIWQMQAHSSFPICITYPDNLGGKLAAGFRLQVIEFNPGFLFLEWSLMVIAMMFPSLMAQVKYIHARVFHNQKTRSVILFISGYLGVWLVAGVLVTIFIFIFRILLNIYDLAAYGTLFGCMVAALWQVSAVKRRLLGYCHQLPVISVSGTGSLTVPALFGIRHGMRCAASCSLLMIPPLIGGHTLLGMLIVAFIIILERHSEQPDLSGTSFLMLGLGAWSLLAPG